MINDNKTALTQGKYYIGLMSGTSADGIDLALVTFDENEKITLHASYYQAYSHDVAEKITSLYKPCHNEIDRAFALDIELAKLFSLSIKALLSQENLSSSDIIAIGSHGQTIRHRAEIANPFTLQIGCCQTLATLTNIRVIGQFRRKDMALGGQGAPLVPAFHQTIFRDSADNNEPQNSSSDVFVVNIGGISNLTFLPGSNKLNVIGYDTGPGNALIDDWFQLHTPSSQAKYDKDGKWSSSGKVSKELLKNLLSDDYFSLLPPKSTGREYFHLPWLQTQLEKSAPLSNQDVQATLTAFTAITIVNAIEQHQSSNIHATKVYLCGGGVHNKHLKVLINQQLENKTTKYELLLTNQKGIDSDQMEAMAFAWLAFAYDKKLLSSMSTVTGASKNCTLGIEFLP